jgi:hypothetical protein
MKIVICCLLTVMLSGCIPIGIQANTRAINAPEALAVPGGDVAGLPALY